MTIEVGDEVYFIANTGTIAKSKVVFINDINTGQWADVYHTEAHTQPHMHHKENIHKSIDALLQYLRDTYIQEMTNGS